MNYNDMKTVELRKLVRERGLGSGVALAAMQKETCIALLEGRMTWEEATGAASSNSGASTCEHSGDAVAQIAAGLAALLPKRELDEGKVREIAATAAAESVAEIVNAELDRRIVPTRVEIRRVETGDTRDLGVTHKAFPTLLQLAQVREKDGFVPPIYLYGPAGTGKTTSARKLAEALGVDFYYNGAIGCAYEITGYNNAAGDFVETPFYKAYTRGGVYLFDELDSSNPNAVLAFNAALANGHASFACGNVKRHPASVIIAAGNTDMRGARDGYSGRVKMDAAFRDRFVYLEWGMDPALEQSIADGYGDSWGWADKVRAWRRNAERAGVRDFEVTPRATGRGLAMLNAGVPLETVIEACVRKALPAETWAKINEGV